MLNQDVRAVEYVDSVGIVAPHANRLEAVDEHIFASGGNQRERGRVACDHAAHGYVSAAVKPDIAVQSALFLADLEQRFGVLRKQRVVIQRQQPVAARALFPAA